jgi:phosphoribosyl-AMP cyclohydrolase
MITMENETIDAILEKLDFGKLSANGYGIITIVAQDWKTKEVVMVGYATDEAVRKTLETGTLWYYSRDRNQLWQKGATSGNYQLVKEISADCDSDALVAKVVQLGKGACHLQERKNCFDNGRIYVKGDEK